MKRLIISRKLLEKMIAHCTSVHPYEACGILAGRNNTVERVYEMKNTEQSSVSYFMDPKEQFAVMKEMRNDGLEMTAIYHSHPHSPPYPSLKDVSLAFYPDTAYVIVGLGNTYAHAIKAFEIVQGNIEEIEMHITESTSKK